MNKSIANLKEAILQEHSRQQRDKIIAYIGIDKKRFAELMQLFFAGEYRISQRASWPMSYIAQKYPQLITPYFTPLINNLKKKGLHNAIIRNTLRLLQDVPVPKKYQGKLMDSCFHFIESAETPVAIKAFALTILHGLAKDYPGIFPELKIIIETRWEQETAAFRSRAKKILQGKSPA